MTAPLQDPALAGGAVRALACPQCGAAIPLRAGGWTETVACGSCGSVLDAADPNLRVLRTFAVRTAVQPLVPLGTRGTLPGWGAAHEVIGFQVREIRVEGTAYRWREYVCFNPYRGFRYLTEYDGHWSDVVPVPALVEVGAEATTGRMAAHHDGTTFRHFQTAQARTTYVLGEFPWEVRTDDLVETTDFVAPPHLLSRERERDEVTWSRGTYVAPDVVWQGFALAGSAPAPRGVYASQPSPWGPRASAMWRWWAVLALATMALVLLRLFTARDADAFSAWYDFRPGTQPAAAGAAAFVTPSFTLEGGRANVVIETRTELQNQWMFVDYALVGEATGQVFRVGRELGYYRGRDTDGSWTEGSQNDRVTIGPVPGGRYFLRIEPSGGDAGGPGAPWNVVVRRDVPRVELLLLALGALVFPPIVASGLAASFEGRRWAESDHAPSSSADDEGEDD